MSPSTSRSHISNPQIRWWFITSTTISSWCTFTYRHIWIFSIFTLSNCFGIIIVILLLLLFIFIIISITTTITIIITSMSTIFFRRGSRWRLFLPLSIFASSPSNIECPSADFLGGCPAVLPISLDGVLVVGLDGHWAPPPPQLVSHGVSFPLVFV